MNNSPSLHLRKLILVGHTKDYTVNFQNGLNIIYGDMDTGKSSILNLVDYMLGGRTVFLYDEIEKNGKLALLELELNSHIYTIKRDIFNNDEYVEVFSCPIKNIDSVFPSLYGPTYTKEGPAGFYSDFLLRALNIPLIKVKKSPTKVDSEMSRVSFRDIFKYCYLDQDEVGNKNLIESQNYAMAPKYREVFKFIHLLLDTQVMELEREISDLNSLQLENRAKFKVISSFFRDTQIPTLESLYEELVSLKQLEIEIDFHIHTISNEMKSDSEHFESLREVTLEIEQKLKHIEREKILAIRNMERYQQLRKEYEMDIKRLSTSSEVNKRYPNLQLSECPLCNSQVNVNALTEGFQINHSEHLIKEIKVIKSRIKELNNIIKAQVNKLEEIELNENELSISLSEVRNQLDSDTRDYISPYLKQRDFLISEKSTINEKIHATQKLIKIRNQLNELIVESDKLANQIKELHTKLELLKASKPSIDLVLSNVGSYLQEFLSFIPIRNNYGISIDEKTYTPIVREKKYSDLTSGGLRTLTSVGFILSLLKNSMLTTTNYPSLIMIDTIGKYLGKTQIDDSSEDEALNDPTKYKNLYNYLLEFTDRYKDKMQILIVDNDLPKIEEFDKLSECVIEKFSVEERPGVKKGFIDNA